MTLFIIGALLFIVLGAAMIGSLRDIYHALRSILEAIKNLHLQREALATLNQFSQKHVDIKQDLTAISDHQAAVLRRYEGGLIRLATQLNLAAAYQGDELVFSATCREKAESQTSDPQAE